MAAREKTVTEGAPAAAPAAAPAPADPAAALVERVVADAVAKLREEFAAKLAPLSAQIEAIESRLSDLATDTGGARRAFRELRESFKRLAVALDRPDFLHPPATVEQVEAAIAAGRRLKVLRDYKAIGITLPAGRELEPNQINVRVIVDAVARGVLLLSVLSAGADED